MKVPDYYVYVHPDHRPGDDATVMGWARNQADWDIPNDATIEVRESPWLPVADDGTWPALMVRNDPPSLLSRRMASLSPELERAEYLMRFRYHFKVFGDVS